MSRLQGPLQASRRARRPSRRRSPLAAPRLAGKHQERRRLSPLEAARPACLDCQVSSPHQWHGWYVHSLPPASSDPTVGDVSPQETCFTIENLQPDHLYIIRIVTLNTTHFQAPSIAMRLRTRADPRGARNESANDASLPAIRANRNMIDVPITSTGTPAVHCESDFTRRNSHDQCVQVNTESIKELTQQMDALRQGIHQAEQQMAEDEQAFQTEREALLKKREEIRQELDQKNEVKADLNKSVGKLERAFAATERKKSNREKQLRGTESERKRQHEEVERWRQETDQLRTLSLQIQAELQEHDRASTSDMQQLSDKLAEETQAQKDSETAMRELGMQNKDLEEGKSQLEHDTDEHSEADEDRRWEAQSQTLQQNYKQALATNHEAQQAKQLALFQLNQLQHCRINQPPAANPEGMARTSQPVHPVSIRELPLPASLQPLAPGAMPGSSSAFFAPATTLFDLQNRMPSSQAGDLAAGPPLSPTVGTLLPSDLFVSEPGKTTMDAPQGVLPGLGAYPIGHSPTNVIGSASGPVTNPDHGDATGQHLGGDKGLMRSSSLATTPTNRLGTLFGLNRQRGKTLSDQGPMLGSLKPSHTQSLPRQDALNPSGLREGPLGPWKQDPWPNPTITNAPFRPSPPRSTKSIDASLLPRPSTESQRRFGWPADMRVSPLGADWAVGALWSQSDRPSKHGSSGSLVHELRTDDAPDDPVSSRSPTQAPIGTRPPSASRATLTPPGPLRQLNPAAPSFRSLFKGEKKEEDRTRKDEGKAKRAAEKAAKEARKAERNFEKRARADKSEKRKGEGKALPSETSTEESSKETSPPKTRHSRDDGSISTAESASPRTSLEQAISQASESGPSSLGRESFMQRLSRKSSSSQFFPGFGKAKNARLAAKRSDVVTPDEAKMAGI